jgi:predicted metal-binding protein
MARSDEATFLGDTTILVCRDCCCGTKRKHAGVDHDEHLERLEHAARLMGNARVLVTRCLDVCARSNVVVVRTRVGGQPRSVWFGEVLSSKRLDALCTWLRAGGLRTATPLPATLAFAAFPPSEESSHCAIAEERGAR